MRWTPFQAMPIYHLQINRSIIVICSQSSIGGGSAILWEVSWSHWHAECSSSCLVLFDVNEFADKDHRSRCYLYSDAAAVVSVM